MIKWRPEKNSNRYYNPHHKSPPESLLLGTLPSFLRSFISRFNRPTFDPAHYSMRPTIIDRVKKLRVTWIGHSSFLIQLAGKNILTDPIFGNVTPLFKRLLAPGIPVTMLPPIDYVLISHNHRDHMDGTSLQQIKARSPMVQLLVPEGNKGWCAARAFRVQEYSWWESFSLPELRCTFLPAVHWSQRGLFDKNKTLWGSWMIEGNNQSIYFAGDTAQGEHFHQIAQEFSSIDCALMPIGPCEPHDWMQRTHISSQGCIDAFMHLKANAFIPMHWATFPFGNDAISDPITQLKSVFPAESKKRLFSLKVGESWMVDNDTNRSNVSDERMMRVVRNA